MKFHFILLCLLLPLIKLNGEQSKQDCTDVLRTDESEPLLVLSTLNGDLLAIDPNTGEIKWKQVNEPSVKTENKEHFSSNSVYFPDPVSGSLYKLRLQDDNGNNVLKKLPFTIPELVTKSPCKSSDGILYSGKKSDNWFMIDPKTGKREWIMGFGTKTQTSDILGYATSRSVYLGRTQYTVLMYDTTETNSKPWNITFFDYNSHTMSPEILEKYEFIHVTSSTTGKIVTMSKKNNNFLWQLTDDTYKSPIVAIFILSSEGFLSVPFTTVSENVIEKVIDYSLSETKSDFQLYETVYVGETIGDTFYAIPSYVDDSTRTIKKNKNIVNLLEGPKGQSSQYDNDNEAIVTNEENQREKKKHSGGKKKEKVIYYGYYETPATDTFFETLSAKSRDSNYNNNNELSVVKHQNFANLYNKPNRDQDRKIIINPISDDVANLTEELNHKTASAVKSQELKKNGLLKYAVNHLKTWMDQEENKILKLLMVILIGVVITMFWYFHTTVKELRQQSQNGSKTFLQATGNSSGSSTFDVTNNCEDDCIKIGKITFHPQKILGKGCEGTFVFKGTFENRDVAVKRLLPDCFTLADREVALLRESDTHENVVRYFCTESDRQFRYIAVELCSATLQEYIEGKNCDNLQQLINTKEVLYQATSGLNHLHHLNIVHRDIKPQNVLISLPDNKNRVRALISDFGLCKKMNIGKASFSKKSGVTGTDGWIAPEMLKGHRTTVAVDIFSMGCVYYYVLSNGKHPFGDNLKRQANILANEYDISDLSTERTRLYENILATEVIADMINKESSKRPSTEAILKHPLFWREEKILSFFQDVSDRIEKLDLNNEPLRTLERNATLVVREDWSLHLHENITSDLRKYRGYYGISVRCLLRALRNKKHHYHELSSEMQKMLGAIPTEFVRFWIIRFPHLLSHTYHSMEQCSKENIFKRYYSPHFQFTKPEYLSDESLDNFALQNNQDSAKPLSKEKNFSGNKSKENRTQPNNFNKRSKGAYNFLKVQGNAAGKTTDISGFITRDMMQSSDVLKGGENLSKDIVWKL